MKPVKVRVEQVDKFHLLGKNSYGNSVNMDTHPKLGGQGKGSSPMELVLMGMAGCASFDLLAMFENKNQIVDFLAIDLEGIRGDETPAVYRKIHLSFMLKGAIDTAILEESLELAVEKYCSVCSMINKTAEVTYDFHLND